MLGGVILITLSAFSLGLYGISLTRLKQREIKYDFKENAHTLMWRFLSIKHFVVIYSTLVVFWAAMGVVLGLRLIFN